MTLRSLAVLGFFATAFFVCLQAKAAPLTFNVDGVIKDSTNQPLEAASVAFRIDVKDANETCLLYREDFTVVMTGSGGYFSIVVGNQTNAVSGGVTLEKVFANHSAMIPGQSCTYTPASASATRKIIVSFDDGVVSEVFSSQEVQSVPYALESLHANKVGAYDQNHILRIDPAIASPVNSDLDATKLAELFRLVNSPGAAYLSSIPTLGGDVSGTLPAMSVDKIKGYTVATPAGAGDNGKVLTFNSVSGWILQTAPSPGDSSYAAKGLVQFDTNAATSGMVFSSAGVAKVNVGVGAGQILQLATAGQLPALDGSLLTNVTVADSSITSAKILNGTIADTDISGSAAITWSKISAPTTVAGYGITDALKSTGGTMSGALNMGGQNITNAGSIAMGTNQYFTLSNFAGAAGTAAGQMWYDGGVIKYFDGTTAKSLGVAGSGMSSTLNSGQIWVGNGSNVATAVTLGGDVTMNNSGTVTIDASKITTTKINDGAITAPKLSSGGVVSAASGVVIASATGNLANFTCSTSGHVLTWTVTGWTCAYPTSSLPALNDGKIWIGDSGNSAVATSLTGDATLSNTGVLSLVGSGVAAGTYSKVTVDAKGRVTTGGTLAQADIIAMLGYTPSVSGSGMQSLNGSTQSTQTFAATTTTAAAPAWSTNAGTGVHTLNIPMASGTGATAGLISKTEYDAFNSKLSTALNSAQFWVGNGSNVATAVTMSGDTTMTSAGAVSIGTGKVTSTHILDATITSADLSTGGTISATSGVVIANTGGNLSKFVCSTAGDVLIWTASGWSCGLPTGLGYTPVNKAGDTMTGTLGLPANGFTIGSTQLVAANGYIGFGTTNPVAAIDVQGSFAGPPLTKFTNSGAGAAGAFVNNGTVFANFSSSAYAAAFMGANVGVGTTTPAYPVDVVGDIRTSTCLRTSAGIASGTCASDERLKTDIQSFDLGLEALQGIYPKYYRYNGLGGVPRSETLELGILAQDVEKTAPELVVSKSVKLSPTDTLQTEIKTVNYNGLLYIVINAVKELFQKWAVDSQQIHRELASVKAENEVLKKDTALLREENAAIKSYLCAKDRSAEICK